MPMRRIFDGHNDLLSKLWAVGDRTGLRSSMGMAAILHGMSADRPDAIRLCRSAAEIESAQPAGILAALLHLEGYEAIGADLDELHH